MFLPFYYRQSWALVGVIGDRTSNSSEAVQDYVNHNTAEQALARREFTTVNGVDFSVSAYSEWIEGTSWVGFNVEVADGTVLDLLDDVTSWREGDRIVIASTDYSMYQAEEFTLLPCPKCTKHQVKIKEKPQFPHVGEILDGVDMRAEVGILSRNIVIQGEMEGSCYGSNMCQFFNTDTFGGHIQILKNFTSVHLSNVELKNMGQQAQKKYPLHFHLCGDVDVKGGYRSPTYVDSLSIHHCFSRCLGIHATNGLLVKDTIGYDTLGHCFFLEDGIEERNVLFHNLGLLTKPGTQLPTDRNDTMCTEIRDKVNGKYIPVPATDCKAVSTFWIANPNNHLISNAAAGSQDTGMWYLFHSMSTGDSHGLYPETKAELTPLGKFYNNRVHSNFKAGLFIDKGVKTTHANSEDPREYLCLDNNARFRPHENADPSKPRVPALIESLITFKNNDHGAWVRGGDITITNSAFADNGIGLTFASDGSFPKDEGASQTVLESLFIGESKNYGFPGGQNKYFGTGWPGNRNRTLPRNKTFPIRGFQIYDGPVHLTRSTFRNFVSTSDRYTSAIGFFMKNAWQLTPKNKVSLVKLDINVSLKVFFCKPGPWFEDCKQDGDKNAVFNDFDGSVSGYKDMLVGRLDNFLIRNPDCINVTDWNGIICKGKYAQIYVQTWNPANNTMSIVRDEYPDFPMLLRGINQNHRATFQQYQPVVMLQKDYTVHWNGKAPENIVIYLINFDKNDWIRIALCYPRDTIFQVKSDVYQRLTKVVSMVEEYTAASSIKDFLDSQAERKYFFDNSTGLLFIYLQARNERDGQSYCSSFGCERLNITATIRSEQVSNCMAEVDQKYRKTPTIISPVPLNNSVSVPCRACGTSQVIFSSDPERTYIPVQVKSLSKVEIDQGDLEAFISVSACYTQFLFNFDGLCSVLK
ncbi:cell surface hyaluronidase [Protopterus annectens]|uniref:cell surface hyaluronidase n=1 Tax=Protopterus annectens TaxID=7888 RepID=UPI001CFA73E4|nr:cell surface hyaluronidase [Protopterus annectens]